MTSKQVAGMLYLLRAEPTLLPAAPDEYTGQDMDARCHDQVHVCLRCGKGAQCAYVAETELGPRWLDLCADDDQWLRQGLYDLERP